MGNEDNWDKFLTQMTTNTGNNSTSDPKFSSKIINDSASFKTETFERSFGNKTELFSRLKDNKSNG